MPYSWTASSSAATTLHDQPCHTATLDPSAPLACYAAGLAGPDGEVAEEREAPNQRHSPWELFPPGATRTEEVASGLDDALRQRMAAAVAAAGAQVCGRRFGRAHNSPLCPF